MNIGNYTKTLRDELRKGLLITLTLLFVCPGAWGQDIYSGEGSGTSESPYIVTSVEQLDWVCSHGGYAKLHQSLEDDHVYTVSNNSQVTIDLNGLTIKDTFHDNYTSYNYHSPLFRVTTVGCSLTILDSSGTQTGEITGAYSKYESSSIFHPYHGGGILNYGTVTIKSGKITGNHIGGFGSGGGIYNATGATLNIEGGEISGNTAEYEGAGIYNATGATLNISGGTISGNSGRYGDGIYNAGTMTITGNPTITGNSDQNIYLTTENKITIGTGGLTSDANSIGITMQTPGIFTTGATHANDYTKFFSDDNHYEAVAESTTDNSVALKSCWSLLDKQIDDAASGSTITLTKNYEAVTTDIYLSVPSTQDITIDLNGYTLNRKVGNTANDHGCVINNGGVLTIQDTSEGQTGALYGGNNTNGGGGIHNEGTLNFNGGTIRDNKSSYSGGGIYNKGTLNINGGIIRNNTTTVRGAGIYNEPGKSVTINSGTIQSNTNSGDHGGGIYNAGTVTLITGSITQNVVNASSRSGGGIYNAGTLYIQGGNVTANTATQNGAGIFNDGEFHLQGAPAISTNTVGSNASNVYLTTAHPTITIDGDLTNSTLIGINMQTFGVFTSGLNNYQGTYERFTSEASNIVKLTENASHEAELVTYWTHLKRKMEAGGEITLEQNKNYQASIGEEYLHVPSDKTVTLHLNGATIDRNLNSATDNGCVIYNEGTLTISGSGTIRGGHNSDAGAAKGGGICNVGTLTVLGGTITNNTTNLSGGGIYNYGTEAGKGVLSIEGGTIQGNSATNTSGGGIYHNGMAFNLKGGPTISGNFVNNVANNVYLAASKTITITDNLTNTTKIGISSQDIRLVFTSGLNGKGDSNKFSADISTNGVGLNSSGEAIVGPAYNLTKNITSGTGTITILKNNSSNNTKAVQGEDVSFYITATSGYVPVSLTLPVSTGVADPYPKTGVNYRFDMPGEDVTIAAVCQPGGYCGDETYPNQLQDVKYYLNGTTLTFVTKDDGAYAMKSYSSLNQVPWYPSTSTIKNTYTEVSLSNHITSISPYAFANSNITGITIPSSVTTIGAEAFYASQLVSITIPASVTSIGNLAFLACRSLTAINVDGGNAHYTNSADAVLYTKSEGNPKKLIQYPVGSPSTTYTLPATVDGIEDLAFVYEQYLETISVAGGTYFKITDNALYSYDGKTLYHYPAANIATTHEISDGVTAVKPYAFYFATNLQKLYVLPTTPPTLGEHMTTNNTSFKILVKKGYGSSYKSTWYSYASRIYELTLEGATVSLTPLSGNNPSYYDYTGSEIKPEGISVVSIANFTLEEGVDYTVSYNSEGDDYKKVGNHIINITGIGYYAGTSINTTYTITRKVDFVTGTGHYGTYYNADPVDLQKPEVSGDYTYVYMITQIEWTSDPVVIHLNEVNYFPHGVPCLLYLTNSTLSARTFHLVKRDNSALSVSSSPDFIGVPGNTTIETLPVGKNAIYALKNDKFVRATGGTLPANRCYIARPKSVSPSTAPAYISIGGNSDDTTGITMEEENGKIENLFSPDWYTIDGVKLNGMPTKKGIYLNNGRKVIIK